jgi:hypothetical protein
MPPSPPPPRRAHHRHQGRQERQEIALDLEQYVRVQRRGLEHGQQATEHRRGDRSLPSGDQAPVLHARLSAAAREVLREKERDSEVFL